ncbi:6-bladed beta-propeller [Draconibacterium sediminis]|uniref:6-bladed beta-propeller n=1 Tax=Draconibacterium sediminis TaxID=1544798 RepID=UPI0026EB175E|nr:6-bladed beta-propeller [Draconibacterium sediminis]
MSIGMFVIFFTASCVKKTNNIQEISLSNPPVTKISLSNVTKNLEYLNIDSRFPIKYIQHFEYADNNIFISCSPAMIIKCDKDGGNMIKIGAKGRGPEEYQRTLSFTIDTANKHIIVLANSKTLKFYDFSGQFVKTINLEDISDFNEVLYIDKGKLLLTRGNAYGKAKYNWVIINLEGKIIETKKNHITFDIPVNIGILPSNIVCRHRSEFHYYETFNDTIFKINEDTYTPNYIFKKDEFRMTPNRYVVEAPNWINKSDPTKLNKRTKYYQLLDFFMTNKYFWIEYSLDYNSEIAVIDRKSNELYRLDNSGQLSGVENDYDSGLPFYPNFYYEENGEEYLITWIDAYKLKNHISLETFKKSKPVYPEAKKELIKFANSIDESDNPVLILLQLK